jgi:hypothetical protein
MGWREFAAAGEGTALRRKKHDEGSYWSTRDATKAAATNVFIERDM